MRAAGFRWQPARTWLALILYWLVSMIGASLDLLWERDEPWINLVMLVMVGICVFNPRQPWPWWKKALAFPVALAAQAILQLVGIPLALVARRELMGRVIAFSGALPVVIYAMRQSRLFVVPKEQSSSERPAIGEVLTDLKVEIHFHDQDRVSVIVESAGGIDEKLGELTLFAAYACRQMVNLGGSPPACSLANLLVVCSGSLQELTGHRNPDGVRLVGHAGAPGRKRFEARLRMANQRYSFTMNTKGFGLFGQGLGYYASTSVTMLLQHLVERRLLDEEHLAALAITAKTCGETYLNGRLTAASQNEIALSAAMLGPTAIEHAKATASEPGAEADPQRSRKAKKRARIDELHDEIGRRDPLAYDEGILALLEESGSHISMEDWLNIFAEGGSPILFRDFGVAMKNAFHSVVAEQSVRLREHCPEAVPEDVEELHRDVGGYVMNGYIIGRHLLGTHQDDLSPLTKDGDPQVVAARLLAEAGRTPSTLMFTGGVGINTFIGLWVDHRSKEGVYGRIADRTKVPMNLTIPILNGFALAIAEHKIARS